MFNLSTCRPPLCHIVHVLYHISQILTEWLINLGQLVTFVYFLCPLMLLNITKKITRVDHDTEGCKKLGKFWSKLLVCCKREFFWKTDYHHYFLSSKPHHPTFQTNP